MTELAKQKLGRRELIITAAASSAAIAMPAIVPAGVIGRRGRPGANDRIVTATIGCGGQGSVHIMPDAAAVCDVDDIRLARAVGKVEGGKVQAYTDFRRILDRKDIDAVFIGTPDHWHALMTVMACQAGKHVYTEKPTARTIEEGRAMVNAARYYKRVVQVGMQGRSHKNAWYACQFVRNGQIGKVRHVEFWHPDNPVSTEWLTPKTVPSILDWDMWLGPARWLDYHPIYHPANFRWFMDLGGGQIRDRGNHAVSTTFWVMGMDDYEGTVVVEATGKPQTQGCYDVPLGLQVKWEFPERDWVLTWAQPGIPKMKGLWGATYHGDRDSLVLVKGDGNCEVEEKAKQYAAPPNGFHPYLHPKSDGGNSTPIHQQNFLECIKTGAKPASDIAFGHKAVIMCILANMAWKLGRKLTFDLAKERFVDDPLADRLISEPMRAGWAI